MPGVVITVARQLGSGGSHIALQVSRRLGYAFVDRQILQEAAKELGVEESEIERREGRLQTFWEKLVSGFNMGTPYPNFVPRSNWITDERLAEVEHRLMAELAMKGSCVMLGRGAFYLLRGRAQLLSVMIHAPLSFRVERLMRVYNAKRKEAVQMIEQSDRDRYRYIRSFTGRDWFDARNYDLAIDTSIIDFASAEEMISSIALRLPEGEAWPWVNEPG